MWMFKRFEIKKAIGILGLGSIFVLLLSRNAAGSGGPLVECFLTAKPYIQVLKNSQNSAIRIRAVTELAKIPNACNGESIFKQKVQNILIEVLKTDPAPIVRSKVAITLEKYQYGMTKEAIQKQSLVLIDVLKNDKSPEVRFSAAIALWDIKIDTVHESEFEISEIADYVNSILPELIKAAQNSQDTEIKYLAIGALGKIGSGVKRHSVNEKRFSQPQKVLPVLLNVLMSDPDKGARSLAAESLAKIESEAERIVPNMIDAFKQEKELEVQLKIVDALGGFGKKSKSAMYTLEDASKRITNRQLHVHILRALGQISQRPDVFILEMIKTARSSSNKEERIETIKLFASEASHPRKKEIVSSLIEILMGENDPEIRRSILGVLSRFKSEYDSIIPFLLQTFKSEPDADIRRYFTLIFGGYIYQIDDSWSYEGEYARNQSNNQNLYKYSESVVPALIDCLKNDNDSAVRSGSASSLRLYVMEEELIISELSEILRKEWGNSKDPEIEAITDTLSAFSPKKSIPTLSEILRTHPDKRVRSKAASALANTVDQSHDLNKISAEKLEESLIGLENGLRILEAIPASQQNWTGENLNVLRNTFQSRINDIRLEKARRKDESEQIPKWLQQNKWIVFLALFFGVLAIGYCLILWLRPRLLLFIPSSIRLPKMGKIPFTIILWLKYPPRVMDAWVTHYLGSDTHSETDQPRAKLRFWEIETVSQHQTYIPLPLNLSANQQANRHENLPLTELQGIFRENIVQLLLYGEGGVGKTSLACHLAQLAMVDKPSSRLCKQHPMLPILIEPELLEQELALGSSLPKKTTVREVGAVQQAGYGIIPLDETVQEHWDHPTNQALIEAIRKQVQFLINEQEPISDELLKHLLQAGRILVIIDRVSEMSQAARQTIDPTSKTYPINALVLTSRQREKIGNIQPKIMEPLSLSGSELMRFIEEYLKVTRNIELQQQPKLYQACDNLQQIVKARGDKSLVTVLLAKLAADQLIAGKPLPTSIPDLMLKSLDVLSDPVQHHEFKPDNRTVYRDAEAIAWTCLQSTYCPNTASRNAIMEVLTKNSKAEIPQRLNYLATKLRVVDIVGEGKDQIRIALDPMAEYLAGLHLINLYGNKDSDWRKFLKKAGEFDKLAIQGFMLAVQDCCRVASLESKVSAAIVDEFKSFTS
ncbi:MAG: HEAT repeat domain-containing protein [Microcoleus sp.]